MGQKSGAHVLIEGLLHPAFLGAFLVTSTGRLLATPVDWDSLLKAVIRIALFACFYLETARCPPTAYNLPRLLLDVGEVLFLTINFALLGFLTDDPQLTSVGWTAFFALNALGFSLALWCRRKCLPDAFRSSEMLKVVTFIWWASAVITLPLYVSWSNVLLLLRNIATAAIRFLSDLLPNLGLRLPARLVPVAERELLPIGPIVEVPVLGDGAETLLRVLLLLAAVLAVWAFSRQRRTEPAPRTGDE